jgi:hypothetical protein
MLRGKTNLDIIRGAETSLQVLAMKSRLDIELETTNFKKTLRP